MRPELLLLHFINTSYQTVKSLQKRASQNPPLPLLFGNGVKATTAQPTKVNVQDLNQSQILELRGIQYAMSLAIPSIILRFWLRLVNQAVSCTTTPYANIYKRTRSTHSALAINPSLNLNIRKTAYNGLVLQLNYAIKTGLLLSFQMRLYLNLELILGHLRSAALPGNLTKANT